MGLLSSIFGGGSSSSSQSSATTATDTKVGVAGDQQAPILSGVRSQQANGQNSVSAGGNVRQSTEVTDNTNNGTQLENLKLGAGASVVIEQLSDDVALEAITAQGETAAAALQSNLDFGRAALSANRDTSLAALQTNRETTQSALDTVLGVSGDAFDFGRDAIDTVNQASRQQYAASIGAINASNQTAQQAASASESIVRDALGKLADQRAPEGTALTKALTIIAVGALVVWGLVRLLTAKKSA